MSYIDKIIERIKRINSRYITLYPLNDNKTIMKHIGKIPGEIDAEYLEFLKITNGASILDYCFFGLKNSKLGINVYNLMMDLWYGDNLLASIFWGVTGTSTGEYFGYLNKKMSMVGIISDIIHLII